MTLSSCLACRIVAGTESPPVQILARSQGLVLHPVAAPSPVPGWLVLTSEQHVRALYDLDEPTAGALGPWAVRVMRAQKDKLGAEHVYAFAIGDVLHHFHLHLVPRYADTPAKWRGRGVFDALPEEAAPEAKHLEVLKKLQGAFAF